MAHRLLADPEKDGWERSDFPIVCETCLGPNPYVRMQRYKLGVAEGVQMEYGGECHISKRPYTKFRWKPGSDARYKQTIICQEVAKAKNVCQVCLLDLDHNLPVQVRDQLSNAVIEDIPESDVGIEYQLALKEARGEQGAQYKSAPENEGLLRLARTTPYYKRNRARICTYFVHGRCKRGAECPFRHEMPEGGELADQNIRDRYYGMNDPVAKKMLHRLGERVELDPPTDPTITTLYVGNIEPDWREEDLRKAFEKHGTVTKVKVVHSKSCAFVTLATRQEAEAAVRALHDALIIHGTRCKLLWGKPHAPMPSGAAALGGPPGAAAAMGASGGVGAFEAAYPSMDPQLMGSGMGPAPVGPIHAGGHQPPGGMHRPAPMMPPPPMHMMPPPGSMRGPVMHMPAIGMHPGMIAPLPAGWPPQTGQQQQHPGPVARSQPGPQPAATS